MLDQHKNNVSLVKTLYFKRSIKKQKEKSIDKLKKTYCLLKFSR